MGQPCGGDKFAANPDSCLLSSVFSQFPVDFPRSPPVLLSAHRARARKPAEERTRGARGRPTKERTLGGRGDEKGGRSSTLGRKESHTKILCRKWTASSPLPALPSPGSAFRIAGALWSESFESSSVLTVPLLSP